MIKEDKSKQLNTPEALLNLAKINNQAVLFLSKLEVVQVMRMWFVAPDGNVTSFECPLDHLENLLTKLRVVFSQALIGDMETANSNTQEVHIGDRHAAEESSKDALPPNLESDSNSAAQPSPPYATEFRGLSSATATKKFVDPIVNATEQHFQMSLNSVFSFSLSCFVFQIFRFSVYAIATEQWCALT